MAGTDAPEPTTASVLQEVINDLVRDGGQERTSEQHASALRRAIAARGLPEQPAPWVRAVAEGAARGDAYVMDAHTAQAEDVPDPETMAPGRGIG